MLSWRTIEIVDLIKYLKDSSKIPTTYRKTNKFKCVRKITIANVVSKFGVLFDYKTETKSDVAD
jgi:hypothetical protein